MTAFSPLGNGKSYSKLGFQNVSCLEDQTIKDIANKLNISAAQVMNENISEIISVLCFKVLLRWALQRDTVVVTKSSNEER